MSVSHIMPFVSVVKRNKDVPRMKCRSDKTTDVSAVVTVVETFDIFVNQNIKIQIE